MAAGEDLSDALRRMALEQLEVIIAGFDFEADDALLDHKVHLARKAGKRLRALTRLCRDELGPDAYRWANAAVRDQGRRLSAVRTSNVLLDTLDGLVHDQVMAKEGTRELRRVLVQRHADMLTELRADAAARGAAQLVLAELVDGITHFPAPPDYATRDLAAVTKAVTGSYRRARRAMKEAERVGSAHAFHEWRKGVNYLRYQLEAISGACTAPVGALVVALDELSETIGDDHDFADLLQVCRALPVEVPSGLDTLVDTRSRQFRERSLESGSLIFADKPSRFAHFLSENSRSP